MNPAMELYLSFLGRQVDPRQGYMRRTTGIRKHHKVGRSCAAWAQYKAPRAKGRYVWP